MRGCGRGRPAGKNQLFVNAPDDKDDCLCCTPVCLPDSTDKNVDRCLDRNRILCLQCCPKINCCQQRAGGRLNGRWDQQPKVMCSQLNMCTLAMPDISASSFEIFDGHVTSASTYSLQPVQGLEPRSQADAVLSELSPKALTTMQTVLQMQMTVAHAQQVKRFNCPI